MKTKIKIKKKGKIKRRNLLINATNWLLLTSRPPIEGFLHVVGCRGQTTSSHRGSLGEVSSSGVVVGGGGDGSMDPDTLAQAYWHLHVQDRNAWTQEMDLRSCYARFF